MVAAIATADNLSKKLPAIFSRKTAVPCGVPSSPAGFLEFFSTNPSLPLKAAFAGKLANPKRGIHPMASAQYGG